MVIENIIKRSGQEEAYSPDKIMQAMEKSFHSSGKAVDQEELRMLLRLVEQKMERDKLRSVEEIQDKVEEALMERGHFKEARAYILYRQKRTELRKIRNELTGMVGIEPISKAFARIQKTYDENVYPLSALAGRFASLMKSQMTSEEKLSVLVKAATELTSQEAPKWGKYSRELACFSV